MKSINLSGLLRAIAMIGFLFLALTYTTIASAAQGCGQGYHRTYYGNCVLNRPGPWARPAPFHPGCWRNMWGELRCYRRW